MRKQVMLLSAVALSTACAVPVRTSSSLPDVVPDHQAIEHRPCFVTPEVVLQKAERNRYSEAFREAGAAFDKMYSEDMKK